MIAAGITMSSRVGAPTISAAALAALALAALHAAPAQARWSTPRTFAAPYASAAVVATDGRGDAIVAWASRQRITRSRYSASVNVAVRARDGALHTRRIWRSGHAEVTGLAVASDRRGRLTVAWAHYDRALQGPSGVVRAAYGSLAGRFTRSHAVGKGGSGGGPALAAAPDGTVLMVWNARFGTRERDAVAWHRAGRRFGTVRRLSRSSRAPSDPDGLRVAFDAGGAAYVWGSCDAALLRAPARSTRFAAPIVLGGRARGFTLALSGSGRGLASWAAGKCSYGAEDPPELGPVSASVLRGGTFASPVALTAPDTRADGANAIALPGGGIVSFRAYDASSFAGRTFTVPLTSAGFGPARPVAGGLVPIAADGGGDLLLQDTGTVYSTGRVVLRPATGADEPAPATAITAPAAHAMPAAGRGAALLWRTVAHTDIYAPAQRLALAVWRPSTAEG
jgi:hypothetical protein